MQTVVGALGEAANPSHDDSIATYAAKHQWKSILRRRCQHEFPQCLTCPVMSPYVRSCTLPSMCDTSQAAVHSLHNVTSHACRQPFRIWQVRPHETPAAVRAVGQRHSFPMLFITPIAKRLSGLLGSNRSHRNDTILQTDSATRPDTIMSSKQRKAGVFQPPSNVKPPSSIAGHKRKAEAFEILLSKTEPHDGDGQPTKFVRARGPWIAAQETCERFYEAKLVSVDAEEIGRWICGLIISGSDRERWSGVCEVQAEEMDPAVGKAFQRFKQERDAADDEGDPESDEVVVVRDRAMRLSGTPGRNRFLLTGGIVTVDHVIGPLEHPEIFACSLSIRKEGEVDVWKGECQIPKNEIQEWKLVDWEGEQNGLVSTEVYDETALAELARLESMHTVDFYGKLAQSAVMRVDLYRKDGEEWEQRAAEIVEMRKKGDTLLLRFKVEIAPRTWMYLYGTMHAEMKHGRFAEETPGKVRSR